MNIIRLEGTTYMAVRLWPSVADRLTRISTLYDSNLVWTTGKVAAALGFVAGATTAASLAVYTKRGAACEQEATQLEVVALRGQVARERELREAADQLNFDVGAQIEALLDTHFRCSICYEIFVRPTSLGCEHVFCRYCIARWRLLRSTCPVCRREISGGDASSATGGDTGRPQRTLLIPAPSALLDAAVDALMQLLVKYHEERGGDREAVERCRSRRALVTKRRNDEQHIDNSTTSSTEQQQEERRQQQQQQHQRERRAARRATRDPWSQFLELLGPGSISPNESDDEEED